MLAKCKPDARNRVMTNKQIEFDLTLPARKSDNRIGGSCGMCHVLSVSYMAGESLRSDKNLQNAVFRVYRTDEKGFHVEVLHPNDCVEEEVCMPQCGSIVQIPEKRMSYDLDEESARQLSNIIASKRVPLFSRVVDMAARPLVRITIIGSPNRFYYWHMGLSEDWNPLRDIYYLVTNIYRTPTEEDVDRAARQDTVVEEFIEPIQAGRRSSDSLEVMAVIRSELERAGWKKGFSGQLLKRCDGSAVLRVETTSQTECLAVKQAFDRFRDRFGISTSYKYAASHGLSETGVSWLYVIEYSFGAFGEAR